MIGKPQFTGFVKLESLIKTKSNDVDSIINQFVNDNTSLTDNESVSNKKITVSLSKAVDIIASGLTQKENKSESFSDVRAELSKNVPDRTTTIEEKEKAISYIERMLKCDDITPELKNYWENKKDIIEMEIQAIKNHEQAGKDTDYQKLEGEYYNFIQQHWCDNYPSERNGNLNFLDSEGYGLTFYNTCISYLNRILACENLPEEARSGFEQLINHWNGEKQFRLGEINWYNQNHNVKTESFNDVFEEFRQNVPDRTTTLAEKKLAAGYIKRMVCCDDISADLKNYWENKKDTIEMEIQSIKNEQQAFKTEKWEDVAKEFSNFTVKYWVENVLNDKAGLDNLEFNDANEYYNTVRRTMITYCDRLLACSDLPDDMREAYTNQRNDFICDLNYYAAQANVYNKQNGIKTESFNDVFEAFNRNIPDSTSTIAEKSLAISYIERMLTCDDIPNPQYWENKKDTIEMEIQSIKNEQQAGSGERIEDVWKEFSEFTNKYFGSLNHGMSMEEKYENRVAYYNMYKSFINRFVGCTDITEERRAEYMRMDTNADIDLFNWHQEYLRYKNEQ